MERFKGLSYITAVVISIFLMCNVFLRIISPENVSIGWGIIAMIASIDLINEWKKISGFIYLASAIMLIGIFFKIDNSFFMNLLFTWGVNMITILNIAWGLLSMKFE